MKLFTYRGQRVQVYHRHIKASLGLSCGRLFYCISYYGDQLTWNSSPTLSQNLLLSCLCLTIRSYLSNPELDLLRETTRFSKTQ